ncbi:MAG: flagellar hook protein FlgE [Methylomicrobium sp.]|nr:flagellar hook protein FlgE [Methylomicrobium sp.]
MAFSAALSGLNAAQNNLSVTGNNIANANTVGFKKSRSEFVDVYASSLAGVSKTTAGAGVRVANVAQQFLQGNLQFTDNNLDMGISGEGFFVLAKSPTETNDRSYTRSGEFKLDQDGYVVNNQGQAMLAFRPNGSTVADGFSTGVMQPIQINTIAGKPQATEQVKFTVNLDASEPTVALPFDRSDSDTYSSQTSATLYDSFGSSHILTTYFVNTGVDPGDNQPTWNVFHYIDDTLVPVVDSGGNSNDFGVLKFNPSGNLSAPVNADGIVDGLFTLADHPVAPATGANDIAIGRMSYANSTQFNQRFSVNDLKQNGLPAGQLSGIDTDDEGIIFARFSNGGSEPIGQVALVRFSNPQGLSKLGDTTWGQSASSGESISGAPGSNNFGLIQAGALENSNVDLSAQLVNLIVAQQAYQANAQTITTENSIMQTILNIR